VVLFVVLVAGLIHATWNALVKNSHSMAISFPLLNMGTIVVCWPLVVIVGLPAASAMGYLALSILFHCTYQTLLMGAFKRGDFSRSYPIARGVAPFLVALGGFIFADQHISLLRLVGMATIVSGILFLGLTKGTTLGSHSAVLWALATGVGIASYTVIDGLGVRHAHNAVRYGVALLAIQASVWLLFSLVRNGTSWWPGKKEVTLGLSAGALSVVGYLLVLWAQLHAPFAIVSALRETGVLWASLIGIFIFKEGTIRKALGPALLITAGIAILAFA
jgi:drug/metabolite transporter (DMT)-like permease